MSNKIWINAANTMVASGYIPLPVTAAMVALLQTILTEKEAEFILLFNKPKTIEQIRMVSSLDDISLTDILDGLMHKGALTGISSDQNGQTVYRLVPPFPGLFKHIMMQGGESEKDVQLARLFDRLLKELAQLVDQNFDLVMEMFKAGRPFSRVIPVDHASVENGDKVIPHDRVDDIIDKFDTIALVTCYCRHWKSLLGYQCRTTKNKETCLLFGRTARFAIDYQFARQISRDEARTIMVQSAEQGLVHKSYHTRADIENDEYAVCNCCKCCCDSMEYCYGGIGPNYVSASHIARVDHSHCTGCETCMAWCPMNSIQLETTKDKEIAVVDAEKCFGCGLCASKCPEQAILIERIGPRDIFLKPDKTVSKI